MLKRQREEEDVEISDDDDEAMAWSPGRKHKVVILSCTQYTCKRLSEFFFTTGLLSGRASFGK